MLITRTHHFIGSPQIAKVWDLGQSACFCVSAVVLAFIRVRCSTVSATLVQTDAAPT